MKEFILRYWLEAVFGIALGGLSFAYKSLRAKMKAKTEEQDAIRDGMVALLHDRLFQSGMYFLNKGEITVFELENIEELYDSYKKLGGNGTGKEIYERVQELRLKKGE